MPHNIFTIPAGEPFAKALAAKLLTDNSDTPEKLADILILLPTRRACRVLRDAFLQSNAGNPLLLPRMQALGDIDEEELSLSIAGAQGTQQFLNLPPSLPPLRRQILLARAIHQREDFTHGFDQALHLAKALGHLMDQIYTEGLDMKNLTDLVPEDFANHWQITLDFLKILSIEWPDILKKFGVIDIADRRNRLIEALREFWETHPPQGHIIAAGTTGSIPATAKLLKTISNLPNGQIVLPGLDQDMDEQSWTSLGESHPQYGFAHLLETIGITRKDVSIWANNSAQNNRHILCTEIMRPAETSAAWQNLQGQITQESLSGLKIYNCETQQDEANTIAALMRRILEQPTQTAALITPDRNLAKRVAMACRRWDIAIDDSAGRPLSQSTIGRFIMLCIQAFETQFAPAALLAVLKNPLCHIAKAQNISTFEITALRGPKPPPGIKGLRIRIGDSEFPFLDDLETAFTPLLNLPEHAPFKDILHAHLSCLEHLGDGENNLWQGEDGQNAAIFLSSLLEHAAIFPDISMRDYTGILQQFLNAQTLRPAYGTHPRLQILGQLEARLIDADLVILGGLNEGSWPPDPGHDPWMSRPMRKGFGLPGYERSIGLAAHDFAQGFCTPNCVITRAKRIDGTPTIPARWLQRLDTVLNAAGLDTTQTQDPIIPAWLTEMDRAEHIKPYARPAPKPPITARPTRISVTQIETWLKDPYSIYARYVLNLRLLDPLEQNADAAMRGQILHDTLDHFVATYPDTIPKNADELLQQKFSDILLSHHQDPQDWEFYTPRLTKITQGFLDKEHAWRDTASPQKTEIKGEMTINGITIHGRADRIDTTETGAAIIDYKSGGQYSKSAMKNGNLPQLPIEGLILQHGGFEGITATNCDYLGYWVLNTTPGFTEITQTQEILEETQTGLTELIRVFAQQDTPYYACPRADKIPRFHDYAHLERIQEWAAMDNDAEDAA